MSAAGNDNVYAYRFDWDEEPSQLGFDLSVALGAAHGLEIAFVFNDFDGGMGIGYIYPGDEAQQSLANSTTLHGANSPTTAIRAKAATAKRHRGLVGEKKASAQSFWTPQLIRAFLWMTKK